MTKLSTQVDSRAGAALAPRAGRVLAGQVVSQGIAVGTAFVLADKLKIPRYDVAEGEVKRELARFDEALATSRDQLVTLKKQHVSSEQTVRILESQLLILVDPLFMGEVIQRVRSERRNAESVVGDVVDEFSRSFEAMEDTYLRERAADVNDVGVRILRNLMGETFPTLDKVGPETVLVCHQLSPSDVAYLSTQKVLGIAAEVGGLTSHAAILARGLGIPALVGVTGACTQATTGDAVILDAIEGSLRVGVNHEEQIAYTALRKRLAVSKDKLLSAATLEARTRDGAELAFRANISVPAEADSLESMGAHGVGLFRTEYLYMNAPRPPTEEEQYAAYRRVLEVSNGGSTVIRTLDIGGDKNVAYLGIPAEQNPFLGWRSIRFCLDTPELFRTQLRAILRASAHGPVRIMYPMIASLDELRQANAHLAEARRELESEGVAVAKDVPVGVMIEVPAAALIADQLAQEAAFFALGTNDLIQYTMAVDRTNERLSASFETLSVPVLRLIRMVMDAAGPKRLPVSCCGEVAATPEGFLLLLGLGVREFSMNVFSIPQMKQVARQVELAAAQEIAQRVLAAGTLDEARRLVQRYIRPIVDQIGEA
jgi:phosphotransferase system enzyme I (PtsI)